MHWLESPPLCSLLISKYGFGDVIVQNQVVLDPSRVAAQIVSGIGFIGGGLIFVQRDMVRGLTTAAAVLADRGSRYGLRCRITRAGALRHRGTFSGHGRIYTPHGSNNSCGTVRAFSSLLAAQGAVREILKLCSRARLLGP